MGTEIDARYNEDGKLVFNVWNTIEGEYAFLEPLTAEQLRDHMLAEALIEAVKKFDRDFPERLVRAATTGTSRRHRGRAHRTLNGLAAPWRGVEDDDEEDYEG